MPHLVLGTAITHIYMFPPFPLTSRYLVKLNRERVSVVMISPVWPNKPMFPILLNSLRSEPSSIHGRPPTTSHLACITRSGKARRLSEWVINIITQSWRSSTNSSYSNAWWQWDSWCFERNTDPLSSPITDILEFLREHFDSGKQYRIINTLRSAISMTHDDIDGVRVGQYPLICRFLKGVYNTRPPAPRYSSIWDVDVVLSYLSSLPDNENLSFQILTHKVAMLMALSNADRCSDLAAVDLNFRSYRGEGVVFTIPGLTKSRRSGPSLQAFYPSFQATRNFVQC